MHFLSTPGTPAPASSVSQFVQTKPSGVPLRKRKEKWCYWSVEIILERTVAEQFITIRQNILAVKKKKKKVLHRPTIDFVQKAMNINQCNILF